jgi:hypothetical protein
MPMLIMKIIYSLEIICRYQNVKSSNMGIIYVYLFVSLCICSTLNFKI